MKLTKLIQKLNNLNAEYGEMEIRFSNISGTLRCAKILKTTSFIKEYIDLNEEGENESIQSK